LRPSALEYYQELKSKDGEHEAAIKDDKLEVVQRGEVLYSQYSTLQQKVPNRTFRNIGLSYCIPEIEKSEGEKQQRHANYQSQRKTTKSSEIHADVAKRKRRNIEKDTQTTNRKGEKRKERHADNNLTSKDEQQKPEQKKPIFPLNTFHHSPHLHFEEFIVYNDEHAIFWFIMLSIPNILGRLPYDIIFGIKPNALDLVQEDHANRTPDILRLFPD
jgi:hypothetical protein